MPHDPKSHVQSLEWRSFGVRIVVTGSLAYDYIMNFPGHFKDHILPDKVHMLTVSFLVESMRRMRGGVAGNIAYTLALLGERPLVVASAGGDFGEYRKWMEQQGIDAGGIAEIEEDFTASCFINTDESNNQIVAFYPGAMSRYADECRQLGVRFLFDPGKQTPRLDGEHILTGLEGASVLIGNDYEFAMMARKTGRSEEELISSVPLAVVTRGGEGSTIYAEDGEKVEIPIAPISKLTDPTGAGDAYIGGVFFLLGGGVSLGGGGGGGGPGGGRPRERPGAPGGPPTPEEFVERYEGAFGPSPEVEALVESAKR